MPAWEVRPYRPGDEAGINHLFNTVFGRQRSLAAWRWKYEENPASPAKIIAVGVGEGGRILGTYAGIPLWFAARGERILASQPVDICVAAEARGGGRLLAALHAEYLARMRAAGARFSYGFPNPGHYRVGMRRLQYLDLFPLDWVERRLSLRAALARRCPWPVLREPIRAAADGLLRGGAEAAARWAARGFRLESAAGFGPEVDRLQARLPQAAVAPIRSAAHLTWRYVANPEGGFQIRLARRGERLSGYLVMRLRPEPPDLRVAYLLELEAEEPETRRALLAEAAREGAAARADFLRVAVAAHQPWAAEVAAAGLRRPAGRLQAVYDRETTGLPPELFADPAGWDLRLGDTDLFTGSG